MSKAEVIDRSVEFEAKTNLEIRKALSESALIMQGNAQVRCPVDTGRLRDSIASSSSILTKGHPIMQAEIGTNVEYAPYVEYGTKRMKAQPFMRTGAEASKDAIVDLFKKRLGSVKIEPDNL